VTHRAASVMDVEVTTGPGLTLAQERAAQVAAAAVAVDQVLILISIFLMLRIFKTLRTKHWLRSEHYVPPQDQNAQLMETYATVQLSLTQIQLPLIIFQSLIPSLRKCLQQDTA
jgi:hypothetical protein